MNIQTKNSRLNFLLYLVILKIKRRDIMYEYVPKIKKNIKHTSTVQRMPACGDGAINLTPLTQNVITLGDNNTPNGHNAIMLEGCNTHPDGLSGHELKHWVLVAHFLPKKQENGEEYPMYKKIFTVPGKVRVSKGAFYYRSNDDFSEEYPGICGRDDDTDKNVGYFTDCYVRKKSFQIDSHQTRDVLSEISKDADSDMSYSLPGILANNCATWAAKILNLAGITITQGTLKPHSVMEQAEKL